MGQKVSPIGFRLGIYLDWDASWFARRSYGDQVLEDFKIRDFLNSNLSKADVSKIRIEKAGEGVKVIINSAKPGQVIGKKGQGIESLRRDLAKLLKKENIEVSVQEVKKPELDATVVAKNIADQIERRVSYKKAMKKSASTTLKSGAKGIKICIAGRLGGAEIARSEWLRMGSIPLHTLRVDVDYGFAEAKTKYGIIGVKVWISRGEFPIKKNPVKS